MTRLTKWLVFSAGIFFGSSAFALDHVTLQLKWTHAFQFAGYYAAKEQGYYAAAGLDVHIEEAEPSTDPIEHVLNDEAQYGVGTSSLLLTRGAGKPVVVLAVIFQHSPYAIFAAKNRGIENLSDLAGKRVMFEPQSDELIAYLKKEGIPQRLIHSIPHSFNPQDLINGKIDAISGYLSNQPYYFDLANFGYKTFTPRMAKIDFYGDNLFTSEQEIRDHPDRVRSFREASLRGWRYAKDHRDEVIDLILNKYSKRISRDFLRFEAEQMIPLIQPELIDVGYSSPERWKHIADVYSSLNMLPLNFSLSGFLYNEHKGEDIWLLRTLAIVFLLFLLISMIAAYIFQLNQKLKTGLEKLEANNQREQAHNHILELLSTGAPQTEILNALARNVDSQSGDALSCVMLRDKDGEHLRAGASPSLPEFFISAIDGVKIGPNMGSCGTAAYMLKRVIVGDIQNHAYWEKFKELAARAGLSSCWSEPILSSKGDLLGIFSIYHRNVSRPSDADIQKIEHAAHLASIVIETTQTKLALQQNNDLLSKISAEVPGIIFQYRLYPDGHSCFPFISEAVRKLYGLAPEQLHVDATPFFGFRHPDDEARVTASIAESARTLSRWHIEYRLILPGQGIRWRLGDAQPEKLEDGSILWHGFITDITERKNAEEKIRHMAQYDGLTDLPNRALLSDRMQLALSTAKREKTRLALLFLDFDKFKPINDSLGHAIGDMLLLNAAIRMQRCVRESDTVARIGGDEFVVLLPVIETEQDASIVAEKIRQALDNPFEIEGNTLHISTSIGIAIYPDHGEDEFTLSKNADLAMYYAKQNGRNIALFYHHEMKVIGQ